jgi:hypothetical protein
MEEPKEQRFIDDIRELKHREPFIPFQVVMTSGDRYTIENPDLLAVSDSKLVYCMPRTERVVYLRLNQIVAIDDLGARPAA